MAYHSDWISTQRQQVNGYWVIVFGNRLHAPLPLPTVYGWLKPVCGTTVHFPRRSWTSAQHCPYYVPRRSWNSRKLVPGQDSAHNEASLCGHRERADDPTKLVAAALINCTIDQADVKAMRLSTGRVKAGVFNKPVESYLRMALSNKLEGSDKQNCTEAYSTQYAGALDASICSRHWREHPACLTYQHKFALDYHFGMESIALNVC